MKTSTGVIDYHLKGCMERDFRKSREEEVLIGNKKSRANLTLPFPSSYQR
jgi:hypothetical protein